MAIEEGLFMVKSWLDAEAPAISNRARGLAAVTQEISCRTRVRRYVRPRGPSERA